MAKKKKRRIDSRDIPAIQEWIEVLTRKYGEASDSYLDLAISWAEFDKAVRANPEPSKFTF